MQYDMLTIFLWTRIAANLFRIIVQYTFKRSTTTREMKIIISSRDTNEFVRLVCVYMCNARASLLYNICLLYFNDISYLYDILFLFILRPEARGMNLGLKKKKN